MKKILFRADAKPSIGIGDLMSLINLSFYFDEREWESYFIIRSYKAGVELVKKYNLKNIFIIDENLSLDEEIKYINDFIKDNSIDIIFFEITERKLSNYIGIDSIKKVAVNFDGHILNDLDLVIDWDVEAYKFFDTDKYPKTKFLLGAQYVILPKEFYSQKVQNRKLNYPAKKLLIAMGGADELNFTQKVVNSIIKSELDIELNIIVGAGYEHRDELEKTLKSSNLKFGIKQNIKNMLNEYLDADIAIGAGGLTSSELVASKTPAILIATYEHQVARCKYFGEQKFAKYLGFREFNEKELIEAIKNPIKIEKNNLFDTNAIVKEIDELFK